MLSRVMGPGGRTNGPKSHNSSSERPRQFLRDGKRAQDEKSGAAVAARLSSVWRRLRDAEPAAGATEQLRGPTAVDMPETA